MKQNTLSLNKEFMVMNTLTVGSEDIRRAEFYDFLENQKSIFTP